MVTAAGADKKIHILQPASGQSMSFAAHDAPIRDVRFVDIPSAAPPLIASGSWDKTVRYWDIRNTSAPLATLQCGERVYSMDTGGHILVIATAALKYLIVDLANPTVFLREETTQLKKQCRCLGLAPNGKIWAAGTIEGRASVRGVDVNAAK
jgi:mRNA export factor